MPSGNLAGQLDEIPELLDNDSVEASLTVPGQTPVGPAIWLGGAIMADSRFVRPLLSRAPPAHAVA